MTTTKKVQYKTEKVVKDDGTVVNIYRCALADMDTLMDLQDRLSAEYINCQGAIGEIIAKPEVQANLRSICALLPLEQKLKGEVQYLDFNDISENWEQLIDLFFNGGINTDTREVSEITASKVSQLHFLPYEKMIRAHMEAKKSETSDS